MDAITIKLQEMLTCQALDIAQLSEELYAQQKEVSELKKQYAELKQRIQSLADEGEAPSDITNEPPPPHY